MAQWELVDCLESLEEDQENPTIPVLSEAHLRAELDRFCKRRHGQAFLNSPRGDCLSFTLGGPFATFGWYPASAEEHTRGKLMAMADRTYTTQPVTSWCEGLPHDIDPEVLFPVADVVEFIVYYYRHNRLPEGITWETWNPVTFQWETTPAKAPLPQKVAS